MRQCLDRRLARAVILIVCVPVASATPSLAQADPAVYELGLDPGIGFNLISWWNFGGTGSSVWENAVQDIYDHGFREVSISPVRYFNPATGAIAASSTKGPELAHVAAGLARAKSLGMRVTVNPFVEAENFVFWRGTWNPAPGSGVANTFWSDYEQYLVEVAQIAEGASADWMTVGTELKALTANDGHNTNWTAVIDGVDAEFTGELGYAANWDEFRNANLTTTIWEHPAIDFMGIDAYFRIVTNTQADASGTYPDENFLNLVRTAWNNKLDGDVLQYSAARKAGVGMPVVFTEYGLTPFNRSVAQNPTAVADQDEQIMGFEGLIRTTDQRAADLRAIHVWQWGMPGAANSNFYLNPGVTSNISGDFDETLNVPAAQWLTDYASTALLLGDMDGDLDRDFDDIDDFVLGLNNPEGYEQMFGFPPESRGDIDGDADLDFDDIPGFVSLLAGGPGQGQPGAVPEPSTLTLAACGLIALVRRWR